MKKNTLFVLFFIPILISAQDVLTYENSLKTAFENSVSIRTVRLSYERSQELLNAQQAALKSRFSLNVTPFSFNKSRDFRAELGTFNNIETKEASGVLTISQPILLTDATFAIRNSFRWFDSRSDFLTSTRTKAYTNNLYLSLDQPLFTYNRTRLALEDVKADRDYAYLNYIIRQLNLEQQVAQAYYRAYQSKLSLQVAKEEQINSERSFEIIKNKVDAGLLPREELLQAELNLLTSQSSVQNARVTLNNSLDDLKNLIGTDLKMDIDVITQIEKSTVEVNLDKALALGLKNRLELRQRDLDIRASKAGVIRAEATNEFMGNVSLVYGYLGNDENFEKIYDKPSENQSITVSFDIPIYDWGESASRKKAAELSLQSSQINWEDEKKSIEIGIRRAYRNLENQELQIDLAEQNLKIAEQTYEINLERYKNGDLTSLDLSLYQRQLSEKKNGLVDALINYRLALLDLKVQTLWDFEKDQPVDFEIEN